MLHGAPFLLRVHLSPECLFSLQYLGFLLWKVHPSPISCLQSCILRNNNYFYCIEHVTVQKCFLLSHENGVAWHISLFSMSSPQTHTCVKQLSAVAPCGLYSSPNTTNVPELQPPSRFPCIVYPQKTALLHPLHYICFLSTHVFSAMFSFGSPLPIYFGKRIF